MIKEAEKKFTQFLKTRDLKCTPQRQTILKEALRAKGHFSADELLDIAKAKDRSISKATLYRTLSLLTEGKILEEHDFGDGKKKYERLFGHPHHDHLICMETGRIIEFENDEIEEIQNRIADKLGYDIVFHSLKLFCKPKNKSSR